MKVQIMHVNIITILFISKPYNKIHYAVNKVNITRCKTQREYRSEYVFLPLIFFFQSVLTIEIASFFPPQVLFFLRKKLITQKG